MRGRWGFAFGTILLLGSLWAPAPARAADSLGDAVARVLGDYDFDGVARLERSGSEPIEVTRGLANRELGVPHDLETRFKLHSLTKPFTATAVLRAVAQGELALEDSVCAVLVPCPESWRPVAVHHLLRHTSGLPDFSELLLDGFDVDLATTLASLAPELEALSPRFTPGSDWAYSNSGFVLLARILEIVYDRPFAQVLADEVFKPAGMRSSALEVPPPSDGYDGPRVLPGLASGYNGSDEEPLRSMSKMYVIPGAGGMVSTVADVARFSEALFTDRLLPAELRERMTSLDSAVPVPAGLGVFVVERDGLGTIVQHDGGNNGYMTSWQHLPGAAVTLVLLSNEGFADLSEVRSKILEAAVGEPASSASP